MIGVKLLLLLRAITLVFLGSIMVGAVLVWIALALSFLLAKILVLKAYRMMTSIRSSIITGSANRGSKNTADE
jgi:hypothetical protein